MTGFKLNDPAVQHDLRGGVLDPGWHPVVIAAATQRQTKAGTGEMTKLECSVLAGTLQGQKVSFGFLLTHTSPVAQRIGRESMALVLRAINRSGFETHPRELVGSMLDVLVEIEQNPGFRASNRLADAAPIGGQTGYEPPAKTAIARGAPPASKGSAGGSGFDDLDRDIPF
jgi:hypothetical protein